MEPFAPEFPLLTERLVVRPFVEEDYDALYALRSREDVMRWMYGAPATPEEARASLERRLADVAIAATGDRLACVIESATTGEALGECMLTLVSEEHSLAEVGFVLHPDHQGHGYATEATRALLRLAFEELRLHRVIGRCEARNDASANVLERLGMRREAHLVENEWVKGEWQSELVYALLDREWRERAASGA
jgi:RimJ/RimL family protein N-acetyltransferase